jgi:hypothetical protein
VTAIDLLRRIFWPLVRLALDADERAEVARVRRARIAREAREAAEAVERARWQR